MSSLVFKHLFNIVLTSSAIVGRTLVRTVREEIAASQTAAKRRYEPRQTASNKAIVDSLTLDVSFPHRLHHV